MENLPRGVWCTTEGKYYLERCPKCGMENYALNVASGICTWCGFDANVEFKREYLNAPLTTQCPLFEECVDGEKESISHGLRCKMWNGEQCMVGFE